MKAWSGRYLLLAGGALILLTNAVALLGAAWNRYGSPESTLTLSKRELQLPYWRSDRDNSGLALNLQWRTLPAESQDKSWLYGSNSPGWLDRAKLESLGFSLPTAADEHDHRSLSREVLLVLELNGPAYEQSLERFRRHAADESAKLAALPDNADLKRSAQNARDRLKQEENDNSRLFVVDAGTDLSALRSRYPDRQRHAIVKGRIRPWAFPTAKDKRDSGWIEGLSVAAINVPHAFRPPFEAVGNGRRSGAKLPDLAATVAFGQRLEPWIIDVSTTIEK